MVVNILGGFGDIMCESDVGCSRPAFQLTTSPLAVSLKVSAMT
jgi:hypothetical protein